MRSLDGRVDAHEGGQYYPTPNHSPPPHPRPASKPRARRCLQLAPSQKYPLGHCFDRRAYAAGNWAFARDILNETLSARRDARGCVLHDGPSQSLLSFMGVTSFEAPHGWKGYRVLDEK